MASDFVLVRVSQNQIS